VKKTGSEVNRGRTATCTMAEAAAAASVPTRYGPQRGFSGSVRWRATRGAQIWGWCGRRMAGKMISTRARSGGGGTSSGAGRAARWGWRDSVGGEKAC
jgi:hypothetical protein